MHRGAGLLLVATFARVGVERFAERKRSFLASGYAGSESLKLDTAFAAGWRLRCGRFVSAPTPPERCLASRQKFSEAGAAATRPQASAATKIWRSRTRAQPSTRGSLVAETGTSRRPLRGFVAVTRGLPFRRAFSDGTELLPVSSRVSTPPSVRAGGCSKESKALRSITRPSPRGARSGKGRPAIQPRRRPLPWPPL